GPNVLYRNNGDGTFSDVTEQAGVGDPAWSQSAAFVDYDADGLADLMVVNYVRWSIRSDRQCFSAADVRGYCGPSNYQAPMPDTLYHNEGQGHFADVSASAGLGAAFGNGLGVACGDYNNDGLTDIYVANDGMPNQLWLNQGQGKFLDEALLTGCAVNMQGASEAGMGVAAVDADHDGDLDLFMSHIRGESNTFYVNQGGWFEDTTARMGLGAASVDFTGFGLGFADFDHDGLLDLYLVNGRVNFFEPAFDGDDVFAEPNQLFAGRGESQFEEVMPRGGTLPELIATSRGTAFGDLDNDGDTDVVVINKDGPVHLLRNVRGEQGHWIIFRVLNDTGGYALDAVVKLEAAGQVQMRRVQRAYSYGASNDPRVHFGLGTAKTVDRVTVRWIDGGQAEFGPFEAGQIHDLRRQDGDSK
ncbi:MAG: CRTAC1 family protein, partial [Phycisphaerae bacterium]